LKQEDVDAANRTWSLPTAGLLELAPGIFISRLTVEETWQRRRNIASGKSDVVTAEPRPESK
jgi:hypothetical protein